MAADLRYVRYDVMVSMTFTELHPRCIRSL